MVYITGDCHADFSKFNEEFFPEQNEMTREDFVIVCGDFGIWHDTLEERNKLDWLSHKNFTILFVDGNHENYDRLYGDEFPIVDFHGGKAHKIRENIFHLMRGYIFDICGKSFFAFGGASSHDIRDGILEPFDYKTEEEFKKAYLEWYRAGKMFRVNHYSWWSQEMPSSEERKFGLKTLADHEYKVDYIISHCCPQRIATYFSRGMYKPDKLTAYFDSVAKCTEFNHWYFGHYHHNEQYFGKYTVLYEEFERIM